MDKDGNGRITIVEFISGLNSFKEKLSLDIEENEARGIF